jgi:hypothetical protein
MKGKLNRRDGDYWLHNESGETIASSWGVYGKKLSEQNCDEIFGVIDVEKLADEYIVVKPKYREHEHNLAVSAYKEGFNKAMELNKDKVFTLQDMRKAYKKGVSFWITRTSNKDEFSELLTSIQQPSEIEVEIEMREDYLMWKHSDIEKMSDCLVPKLDSEGCLILKKI